MIVSEIAHIRSCIEEELVAMRLGLYGLAAGISQHSFIEAKMQRLGIYQEQLAQHMGEEQAASLCCATYIEIIEGKHGSANP